MLGHHHGVARVDEAVQLRIEQVDVGRMQPGGGLVEYVERVAAAGPLQFRGQLDPLRLAAGQFGGGLPETQIAQPDLVQVVRLRAAPGTSAKNSDASSTVIARTSAMVRSR